MKKIKRVKQGMFALLLLVSAVNFSYADLIVGTSGGAFGEGKVYWGDGNGNWKNLSEGTRLGAVVMTVVYYNGTIYAGTQTKSGYGGSGGQGQIWRYDGGTTWTLVGTLGSSVSVLAAMDAVLYAGITPQSVYRYNGPGDWTLVGQSYGTGFRAGVVSAVNGKNELFLGELDRDTFWKYNVANGLQFVNDGGRSCVYAMKEFQGYPYAGCWHGSFYKCDGTTFNPITLPYEDHIWSLETFQGKLFVGAGEGNSDRQAALRTWDGSALQVVKSFTANNYSEGISALFSDGNKLYVGTGAPDGYYSGDGVAEIWTYDGANFTKICSDDLFGCGVQFITTADFRPSLDIVSASVNPGKVCCGGSALVTVETKGAFVFTKEAGLKLALPSGWTMQSISGPADGNGKFVASLAVPCHITGTFSIGVTVEGLTGNGTPITASGSTPLSVESVRTIPDSETAAYSALQEAILQTRAWDLNLEYPSFSAGIPQAIDLTSIGWAVKEITKNITAITGESTHYTYEGSVNCTGSYVNYYGANAMGYELVYTGGTYTYHLIQDQRPFFSFRITPPDSVFSMKSAGMAMKTSYAYPSGTYTLNLNDLLLDPAMVHDISLFNDCGDGTLREKIQLKPYTSYSFNMALPTSNVLSVAFDMDETTAYYYSYSYTGSTYAYTYKGTYINVGSNPTLSLTYLCGYSGEEALKMMLDCMATNDAASATKLASYLNSRYGYNSDQWSIRVKCEPPAVEPPPTPTVPPPSVPAYSTPLIIAKTTLNVTGNITVSGSIHSDANLIIGGNTTTAGKATYLGLLTLNGKAMNIVGGTSKVTTKLFPTQAQVLSAVGAYTRIPLQKDKKGNPVRTNITAANADKFKGVILLEGSVLITGNVTLNATIIATGNIALDGNSSVTSAAGGWALYTEKGSISIAGNSRTKGRIAGNLVGINALIATE